MSASLRPFRTVAAAVALGFASIVGAAPTATARASAAYQAKDWSATASAARDMLRDDPKSGQAYFFIAVAQMHQDRAEQALGQLDEAARLGYSPLAVEYRRACAYAALGRTDDAFGALDRAVAAGFRQVSLLQSEPLLAGLRGDARFADIQQAVDKALHPCRTDPRYRAFDFWLGTWDVRPNGAPESLPPSENVVTLEYDSCVVMEHWTGRGGVTGSSFNIFDSSRGEWFQTWVDSSGGLHEYHGNPDAKGDMMFTGEAPGGPGQPQRVPTRLSFFRLGPDKVRQFSESSTDGGKTWSGNYDLIYLRRPATPRP